jgi:hypothetical protein
MNASVRWTLNVPLVLFWSHYYFISMIGILQDSNVPYLDKFANPIILAFWSGIAYNNICCPKLMSCARGPTDMTQASGA